MNDITDLHPSAEDDSHVLQVTLDYVRHMAGSLSKLEGQLSQPIHELRKAHGSERIDRTVEKLAYQLGPGEELMSIDELVRELGICKNTLWRLRKGGRVPDPIHISSRKLRFRRSEIQSWLQAGGAGEASA